jgi:hypothetical protein
MKEPKFIPVLFHNLEGYDAHLFIRNFGVGSGDIKCIPKTEEKYISFTKEIEVDEFRGKDGKKKKIKRELRFLDSFKFMASSLDKLVWGFGKDNFRNRHATPKNKSSCSNRKVFTPTNTWTVSISSEKRHFHQKANSSVS